MPIYPERDKGCSGSTCSGPPHHTMPPPPQSTLSPRDLSTTAATRATSRECRLSANKCGKDSSLRRRRERQKRGWLAALLAAIGDASDSAESGLSHDWIPLRCHSLLDARLGLLHAPGPATAFRTARFAASPRIARSHIGIANSSLCEPPTVSTR